MSSDNVVLTKDWLEVAAASDDFRVTFVSRAPACEYNMRDGSGNPTEPGRRVRFPDMLLRDVCGEGRLLMRIVPEDSRLQCKLHVTGVAPAV